MGWDMPSAKPSSHFFVCMACTLWKWQDSKWELSESDETLNENWVKVTKL